MHVIALGHDKKMFDRQSRSFARQLAYAKELSSLHVFISTYQSKELVTTGSLFIHPVVGKNPLTLLWRIAHSLYRQIRICQASGPTVLIVQSPFEFGLVGLGLASVTGVSLQVQVHGDFYSRSFWRDESFINRIRGALGLFILRRANGIRVVSARIAASLVERGIERERITVLPIEADLEDFLTAKARPIWPIEADAVYILSVGRFAQEKNFPLLIQAFYEAHRVHTKARLVLVGEGPEESSLRQLVSRLWPDDAPVLFYPWQQQIASVMKAADIYALSSDHEGYAMVLGEAMASGLPIVTTDVGCAGELVHDDVHAIVVAPRDQKMFSKALSRLLADKSLRTRYGSKGVEAIRSLDRSGDAYTKMLVATWQSLIKNHN
ncbi:MAG: glycosyltransferase family 4 protein [Candidatus Pacebacteria bacterium]|jgi:glycosyltransferase involved in cell wall biosynthesis|nr:glycosyltransferase family 4 protein [Candidatus Paceibacterota bacterium]